FAGAGTSSWWRCSIRRRYPWGALSQSPGRPSRRWRHTLRSCRPQKGRWPPKTSGGRSDRAMREGTNMGIMTTLKKPTAERGIHPHQPTTDVLQGPVGLVANSMEDIEMRDIGGNAHGVGAARFGVLSPGQRLSYQQAYPHHEHEPAALSAFASVSHPGS